MRVMSTALPNLQQLSICTLRQLGRRRRHEYIDGEDPDETRAAGTAASTSHNVNVVSTFRKLSVLKISGAPLNGRYPVLFDFPLLQKLTIHHQAHLKFDLDMLAGLPQLKELHCFHNAHMSGNLRSLRVLKESLEQITIEYCRHVRGTFMNLADFPNLKKLDLWGTDVTGDIRHIGEHDFQAMEDLTLPDNVCGGRGYEFQHVSDAAGIISTLYPIMKQRPVLLKRWFGMLSRDSPDWYPGISDNIAAPVYIEFVQAGSRIGYHWYALDNLTCEVIWLDPEPDKESSDYENYIEELDEIEDEVDLFDGFQQPPNEEEYHRLCAERFDHVELVDGAVLVY